MVSCLASVVMRPLLLLHVVKAFLLLLKETSIVLNKKLVRLLTLGKVQADDLQFQFWLGLVFRSSWE